VTFRVDVFTIFPSMVDDFASQSLMGKARETSPDGASSAAVQVRTKAQQNPVPTAALAAFVGGVLLGRITKRR